MSCAAVLIFDEEAEARIRGAWLALADAAISRSMLPPGFRPHLSLSVGTDFDFERMAGELLPLASATPVFPVGLPSLGVFADTGAVYLGVTPSTALLDLHRRVDTACERVALSLHDWYRPDAWVPHVSLAFGLTADGLAEAVRLLSGLDLKMVVRAEVLALVQGDETGWTEHGARRLAAPRGAAT